MCSYFFDFSQMGLIFPHPLIYTYFIGFSTYHLYTIIFTLYANYAPLCASCFTSLLIACLILRRCKPISHECFVSHVFLEHHVTFLSRGIFAFIFPVGINFFFTCEVKSSSIEFWVSVFVWRGPLTLYQDSEKTKTSCVTAYRDTIETWRSLISSFVPV